MAKKEKDLPGVEGPGVSVPSYEDLDALGDQWTTKRDKKAKLAKEMTGITTQIVELMHKHNLSKYRFSDQEIIIVAGKERIKIKTVKTDGADSDEDED